MKLVVTEKGERILNNLALQVVTPDDPTFTLALWVMPWDITRLTEWSQLTEATFGGYARINLARGSWQNAATVNDRAYSQYGSMPQQWTCASSPQTVYGYAVLQISDEVLVWAARFSTPRVLTVGATLDVLPVLTSRSESQDGN